MSKHATLEILKSYYAAFNRGDWEGMLACLADDVAHDLNQGERQIGKERFRAFLGHMERCYRERLEDVVLMTDATGTHCAAEFTVHGEYLATDAGLPEARGQTYVLPAGAFLAVENGLISRLTMYYNLEDWTRQVSAA